MIEFTFLQRNSPNVFQNYFETPTKMNALKDDRKLQMIVLNMTQVCSKKNTIVC